MKTKYMLSKDFLEFGFLQEANRLFFHPLGLALEVTIPDAVDETKQDEEYFLRVWDYRNDPEGTAFVDKVLDADKEKRVTELRDSKFVTRYNNFGWVVQPIKESELWDEQDAS